MLASLNKLLSRVTLDPGDEEAEHRLAVAVLLLEIARADFDIESNEQHMVQALLGRHFGLDEASIDALMRQAGERVGETVSLHGFVDTLNRSLSYEDRRALMRMLWQVAYADGRLDPHEEHLTRRLADLLHVPHKDFIREKLRVLGE